MSHELQYLDKDSDYGWGDSITSTNFNYFFVPSIPEWAYSEYDGLIYEGKEYNWSEVEYRLSVDYNSVPEPSAIGVIMGATLLILTLFKRK
jgi:hypothetical protein